MSAAPRIGVLGAGGRMGRIPYSSGTRSRLSTGCGSGTP